VGTATRHLELAGCFNFRDLGGYQTSDGGRIRWKQLYRADGLTQLSDQDCSVLTELGLATVIDLRTADEVDTRGRFPVETVEVDYHHLPLSDRIPGTEEIRDWGEPQFVVARYRELLSGGAPSIARAIELLASPGSLPAVFHCSAGKDRTGVLAAVVLGCLGVPDGSIVEDYALSAIGTARLMESLRAEYADSVEEVEKYAAAILRVMPGSMEGFIAHVRSEFGGFPQLAQRLGVVPAVAALREQIVEPA
jgi:protein tyrosine/serine phosphatase